ncbi:hypothetical protein BGZ58_006582, partial [Dissophora ornata]
MAAPLMLFCLVNGEPASNAFKVKADVNWDVSDLKAAIKAEQTPAFDDITAHNLVLWRVTIPVIAGNIHEPVLLNEIDPKTELIPTDDLSD